MRKVFQAYQSTNTATPPNPQKKKEDLNSAYKKKVIAWLVSVQ